MTALWLHDISFLMYIFVVLEIKYKMHVPPYQKDRFDTYLQYL